MATSDPFLFLHSLYVLKQLRVLGDELTGSFGLLLLIGFPPIREPSWRCASKCRERWSLFPELPFVRSPPCWPQWASAISLGFVSGLWHPCPTPDTSAWRGLLEILGAHVLHCHLVLKLNSPQIAFVSMFCFLLGT